MPAYDYCCEKCGVFTASRPMSEYKSPAACPSCGAEAGRVFVTAPAVAGGDAGPRAAMSGGETKHVHSSGCGCCGGGMRKMTQAAG